jgi:citrate synthase
MSEATEVKPADMDTKTATLQLPDKDPLELSVIVGTENEHALDITRLRGQTGYITVDPGFGNTGSCQSRITFIDGENGILRYRGYPIEQLADHAGFSEVAYLLIWGELPTADELQEFRDLLTEHEMLHEGLRHHFEGFPSYGHPMAILSAMINAASCYHPDLMQNAHLSPEEFKVSAAKLIAKVRTIAAFAYKKSVGQPQRYPDPELDYCSNFLHMMFSVPYKRYEAIPEVVNALRLFLILHADHEQNCSTSTVRMVGSSHANLAASVAAGVCALWGPRHGGANMAVIKMLGEIRDSGKSVKDYLEQVKTDPSKRLMGFGHRVYKNFDPRARVLKKAADDLLNKLGLDDDILDIAQELEDAATSDDYFVERRLYPNVDFYSGIILNAIGIPIDMFTVMFAIGRMPGWVAHWKEGYEDDSRIFRPRQVYTGYTQREFVPLDQR